MSASGDRAVRAMKKPKKLSSGETWEKLEFFPTPPWATRALFAHVLPRVPVSPDQALYIWEPCAGMGHMSDVLQEDERAVVHASDVFDYGVGIETADFFSAPWPHHRPGWIVTNPPFEPAARLARRALELDGVIGLAMLLRIQWLEGAGRWRDIFSAIPPLLACPFAERVPMVLGGYDPQASTATGYAWFVWAKGPYGWRRHNEIPGAFCAFLIPPCRDALSRPEIDRRLAERHVRGFVPPRLAKAGAKQQAQLI